MSKQTVKNMDLTITEMVKQSDQENYKPLKALSHSYETLLSNLSSLHDDFKEHQLTEEIEKQLSFIKKLDSELQTKSIPWLLRTGRYYEVNHLTTTTSRLHSIAKSLNSLLSSVYKIYNKRIYIVSLNGDKAIEFLNNLIDKENESVIEKSGSVTNSPLYLYTNKNTYIFVKSPKSLVGQKIDFIYVDADLYKEDIKSVLMNIKHDSYEMF